ncbi:MAG: S-layer homology domain-containing protein [Clostridia bacterium]|nr:S-layer homology domain-containing protein [Clostridia bacterium]
MGRNFKKWMGFCLILVIVLSTMIPVSAVQVESFSDVPSGHWAYQSINNMVRLGVIAGYPDSTFKPDKYVSREEFAKILCGATSNPLRDPNENTFLDVPTDHWAFKYVETVKDYLTGYPSNNGGKPLFKGTQDATREDVAVALVKIKGFDKTVSPSPTILDDMYKDVYTISSNLRNLMAIAVEKKLITGYPDGTIRGTQTVTRAEAAVLIDRANSIAGDVKVAAPTGGKDTTDKKNNSNLGSLVYLNLESDKDGKVGEKIQATLTGVYSSGKTKSVTNEANWKSLNESIVSVNGNGQISLLKEGKARIRATFGGKTDEQEITVSSSSVSQNEIKSIRVTPSSKIIKEDESYNLKVEAVYWDEKVINITNNVRWSSRDSSIAMVDSNGKVVGLKDGYTKIDINYKSNKEYNTCAEVRVINKSSNTLSMSFLDDTKTLKVGEKVNLQVIATYSDNSIKDITDEVSWQTSNSNVARISVTGEVYGVKEGTAQITAKKDGKSCIIDIVVNK